MIVQSVESAREIEDFIRFRWQVYRDHPVWVPPIVADAKRFLAGKGLFFRHCRSRLFTAREDGKIVATLAVFYDRHLVDHAAIRAGWIGFFEALPGKAEAVNRLFTEAEAALREFGAEVVWGPMNGGIANEAGLLANAYNQPPVFLMGYNPSYYHAYFRRAGYRPVKELMAYSMDLLDGRLKRKVQFLLRRSARSKIRIRPFERKRMREESFLLAKIYAATFRHHWGFAPQSEEEFYEILAPMKAAIDPELILFAEDDRGPVGFTLVVPDYNPVIRRLDGNLEYLSGLAFLHLKNKIREARLIAIGVTPEWRGKGVSSLLMASVLETLMKKQYIKCEYSWVFRENRASQEMAEKFDSDYYKRYLVYEKKLGRL